jgi:uncharacterized protein
MNKSRSVALIAALALAAFPIWSQTVSAHPVSPDLPAATAVIPPDQQATPDQIRKFFEVARVRQQMQMVMGMMPKMVVQSYESELKELGAKLPAGQQLTSQERASLDKIMQEYMHKAMTVYTVDQMIDDAIPIYQRHISRADADALIAFYSSPAGQHILDAQPVIMREYMPVEMNHVLKASQSLTSQMTEDMVNAVKASPAPPTSPATKPQ